MASEVTVSAYLLQETVQQGLIVGDATRLIALRRQPGDVRRHALQRLFYHA